MIDLILIAIFGFILGFLIGYDTWIDLAKEFWRHGFDNHLCKTKGCCVD
jgi:hypothetical protein